MNNSEFLKTYKKDRATEKIIINFIKDWPISISHINIDTVFLNEFYYSDFLDLLEFLESRCLCDIKYYYLSSGTLAFRLNCLYSNTVFSIIAFCKDVENALDKYTSGSCYVCKKQESNLVESLVCLTKGD